MSKIISLILVSMVFVGCDNASQDNVDLCVEACECYAMLFAEQEYGDAQSIDDLPRSLAYAHMAECYQIIEAREYDIGSAEEQAFCEAEPQSLLEQFGYDCSTYSYVTE